MNQVRVTSPTSPTTCNFFNSCLTLMCALYEMCFAHLLPHDVRFMFRFAQHGSHHMACSFMCIGLSVHYIYHMFVSFLTPSEPSCLLPSRAMPCWRLNTAQKWRMPWWKHSHATRKRKLKRGCQSTLQRFSAWCVEQSWISNTHARIAISTNLKQRFCGTRQVNLELHLSVFTRYWWTTEFPLSSTQITSVEKIKNLPSSEKHPYWLSRTSPCLTVCVQWQVLKLLIF